MRLFTTLTSRKKNQKKTIGFCSSIKSLKYRLITLRYSLGDKFSYLSPSLLYSI